MIRILFFSLILAVSVCAARMPNVVFILADDLGWADTTLYGHTKLYQTPNLERLANRGMTFNRAYSASPLCSPTRASILTGQTPARIGLTAPHCHLPQVRLRATSGESAAPGQKSIQPTSASRLRTDVPTLGKVMKEAGYATAHFGKWHLGAEPYSPLEQGFEIDIPHWHGPGPAGNFVAPWKYPDFDPRHPQEHIEDRMAQEASAFIEKHKDEPFFLNYWMFSVHAPFNAKEELIKKYKKLIDPSSPQRSPTYAAMVESMDYAVGTLLDTLDRLEIADDTLIIFFSDNGGNMYNTVDETTPTSNAPLRGGKASMFEGGIRVPMIVAWSGEIEPGSRSDALVQSTDFYPTLLDILDLRKEASQVFDGVSIRPALKGEEFSRDAIFTYFPHNPPVPDWIPPSISVHHKNWKLIREFHQGEKQAHRYRLFDLSKDLGEKSNLAEKYPNLVDELDARIEAHLKESKAIVPLPNPRFDLKKYRPELEGENRVRKKPAPKKGDQDDPKIQGWKARNCTYKVKDGVVTLKGIGADSFLGIGAKQFKKKTQFTMRIKSPTDGKGEVKWSNETSDPESVAYELKAGEWADVTLTLQPDPDLGILRIYLPSDARQIEIDRVSIKSGKQTVETHF